MFQGAYGALWWNFEKRYDIPFTPITVDALNGDLSLFTAIIVPTGNLGRLGKAAPLKTWIERGGTLLMMDDDRVPLKPGQSPVNRRIRIRTLGCWPLTGAVESSATTLDEVILELLASRYSERQGRVIDHDASGSMEEKKREGYF